MSKKFNGRFYFKRTSNGNLLGEFSNNFSSGAATESSDLIGESNGFIGEYNSTWCEGSTPCFARLSITAKPGCKGIFRLEWRHSPYDFDGEAMLCDDMLVGDYRHVKL